MMPPSSHSSSALRAPQLLIVVVVLLMGTATAPAAAGMPPLRRRGVDVVVGRTAISGQRGLLSSSFAGGGGSSSNSVAATGPFLSRIQNNIKAGLENSSQDIEQYVAKMVARQVGDQLVNDMNNITAGALTSMGFNSPQQLGQYIGSWAGWLVTVFTTAANTAIGSGGGGGVLAGSDGGGAAMVTGESAEYDTVQDGSKVEDTALYGNVTEADLLRLQQVLQQLQALERDQTQTQTHAQPGVTDALSRVATTSSAPTPGTVAVAGGGGSVHIALNRTAVEEGVTQLVWRAMAAKGEYPKEDDGENDVGGGGGGVTGFGTAFHAVAEETSPVGRVRGLTEASDPQVGNTTAAGVGVSSGDGRDDGTAAATAAASLRFALESHDTAAASDAVSALLAIRRNERNDTVAAGPTTVGDMGGESGVSSGGRAGSASVFLPSATARRVDVLPVPSTRALGPSQLGTSSTRAPRHGPLEGTDLNVGRDLNVNVNVNVVPASLTMPTGAGLIDGCACTCPNLASGGSGGLAGALAANLLDSFLPGSRRIKPIGLLNVGGGGLLRSNDDGATSMQQSASQEISPVSTAAPPGLLAAMAAMVAKPWQPLADRRNGVGGNNTDSGATSDGSNSTVTIALASNQDDFTFSTPSSAAAASGAARSDGGGGRRQPNADNLRDDADRSEFLRAFSAFGGSPSGRRRQLQATPSEAPAPSGMSSSRSYSMRPMGHPVSSLLHTLHTAATATAPTHLTTNVDRRRTLEEGLSAASSDNPTSFAFGNRDVTIQNGGSGSSLKSIGLRDATGGSPGYVYGGSEYGMQDTAEAGSPSNDQILSLIQALIEQAAGGDVDLKVGFNGPNVASATARGSTSTVSSDDEGAARDGISTRQAVKFALVPDSVEGSSGGTSKAANTNVNPIVLPSLQRSGPEIARGVVSGGGGGCPPCRC